MDSIESINESSEKWTARDSSVFFEARPRVVTSDVHPGSRLERSGSMFVQFTVSAIDFLSNLSNSFYWLPKRTVAPER